MSQATRGLAPLAYQRDIVGYLKAEEPALWQWFASTKKRAEHAEAIRLDLLKSTYRLERAAHAPLYHSVDEVLGLFELQTPVTCYQAQQAGGLNASLAYLPGEVHLVFSGPVQEVLSELELKGVLGHELAHYLLYERWDGEYLVATELLRALGNDAAAAPAHLESARLFGLYTEVFADRGTFVASGDLQAAVSALIKIETGLHEVSAESYLRQAEEIFSKSRARTEQLTHPESYLRARALQLWTEQGEEADAEIERMIEGQPALGKLDLLGQRKMSARTRKLLEALLAPEWFHTEAVLAHARLFFEDFAPVSGAELEQLAADCKGDDGELRDFHCYVLLDFIAVDRELGDPALAQAIELAKKLDLMPRFGELVQKELGISKKALARTEKQAEEILAAAATETSK
ncbi:MAG: hydrolase [Gemmataceae bacterium]